MSVTGDQSKEQGSSLAEVDRIRDIIMGPQMRLYEQQFKRIVSQLDLLSKEVADLRAQTDQQMADLGSHSEQERGRIQSEARQASDKLCGDLTTRLDRLDADLKAQTSQLASDLRAQGDGLRREFTTALDALDDDKASRQNVGDLLIEMGTRLKQQAGITDLLGQLEDLTDATAEE